MIGKVKYLKKEKGFGFISMEGGKDLFFHYSDFTTKEEFDNLEVENEIEFKIADATKGKKAVEITVVEKEDATE